MDPIHWYHQRRMLNAMVQHRWTEAEHHTRKLMHHSGPSMGLEYNLALIALGQKREQQAYDQLVETVARYGESLRLCRLLGDISYLRGDGQSAVRWYAAAKEDDPPSKELALINLRLQLLEDPLRFEKALGAYKMLDQANSLSEENPKKAVELYQLCIDADSTCVEAANGLGCLLLDHFQDAAGAVSAFTHVLSLVDNPGAAKNLARAKKA